MRLLLLSLLILSVGCKGVVDKTIVTQEIDEPTTLHLECYQPEQTILKDSFTGERIQVGVIFPTYNCQIMLVKYLSYNLHIPVGVYLTNFELNWYNEQRVKLNTTNREY